MCSSAPGNAPKSHCAIDVIIAALPLLIPQEQEKTEKITQWLSENITDAFIEKWTDDSVTEMENDLAITSHIRQSLLHEFPNEEVAFLEYLADKYYSDTFLDE